MVTSLITKAEYIALFIATKMAIWVKKIVTNLESFKITNINGVKKLIQILFGGNKTFIQLGKSISNTRKIKHINTTFYKIQNKSKKIPSLYYKCLAIRFWQIDLTNPFFILYLKWYVRK